ncbi:MAG: dihydroneopterin aldolase [Candidatus Hydrogenedentes bacterium]|nr:dihydroneopterin aldolase [Candidatus Hydrogenedentota bacterium]
MAEPLDKIYIRDLQTRCVVGIFPHEREALQDVLINVTLHVDLKPAAGTDNIADTVDYKGLKNQILECVEQSKFFLIEALAEAVAGVCLKPPRVRRVTVTVDKPGALRFARSVAVEIERERDATS